MRRLLIRALGPLLAFSTYALIAVTMCSFSYSCRMVAWCSTRGSLNRFEECLYKHKNQPSHQERPYHSDSTASRLLSEVKHCRARLVLRWGTTLESLVLFFCKSFCHLVFFPLFMLGFWYFVGTPNRLMQIISSFIFILCFPLWYFTTLFNIISILISLMEWPHPFYLKHYFAISMIVVYWYSSTC